jgi:hypothetical protein
VASYKVICWTVSRKEWLFLLFLLLSISSTTITILSASKKEDCFWIPSVKPWFFSKEFCRFRDDKLSGRQYIEPKWFATQRYSRLGVRCFICFEIPANRIICKFLYGIHYTKGSSLERLERFSSCCHLIDKYSKEKSSNDQPL